MTLQTRSMKHMHLCSGVVVSALRVRRRTHWWTIAPVRATCMGAACAHPVIPCRIPSGAVNAHNAGACRHARMTVVREYTCCVWCMAIVHAYMQVCGIREWYPKPTLAQSAALAAAVAADGAMATVSASLSTLSGIRILSMAAMKSAPIHSGRLSSRICTPKH
jgi:hypothetical protein